MASPAFNLPQVKPVLGARDQENDVEEVLPRSQGGCHPSPLAAREDEDGVKKASIILNVSMYLVTIIIAGHQLCESINTSALLI